MEKYKLCNWCYKFQLLEMIMEGIFKVLKDKAIIPVSVGLSNGTRTDYLYNKVDVLISAILEKGYKIVPVSQLDIE